MISVLSFSAWSMPAFAEKDGMVSDSFKVDSGNTDDSTSKTTNTKDPSDTDDKDSSLSSGMSAWDYIKILLALAFVVCLLFFVLKLVNRNNKKYQSNQMLQNLGGVSVGQQKSIQLLKVGNSLFLVGVGDDVHILKEITDEQEQQSLLKMHDDKQDLAAQVPYIAELLTTIKNKVKKQPAETGKKDDFKEELDKKLDQIKKNRQKQLNELNQKEKNDNE
ncbi:MAG: flagellar biosynthetic protein FliO [Kurthia sp.]|nr:flagellar biosynthetic protein FliO [Candidatus Kurthia equi]